VTAQRGERLQQNLPPDSISDPVFRGIRPIPKIDSTVAGQTILAYDGRALLIRIRHRG